jgi:hypothetical protein
VGTPLREGCVLRTLYTYDGVNGVLVLHDHDNLIAVFEKIDWQTANVILSGINNAKRYHALEPKKTVAEHLRDINHAEKEFE